MKERPILFSGPMVRAILEDRKTQTRRLFKKHPPFERNGVFEWYPFGDKEGFHALSDTPSFQVPSGWAYACPYGVPGDRLWVRETFSYLGKNGRGPIAYRASTSDGERVRVDSPWHPSIHMPRWASRLTLEITDIRVQRVREISEEDAIAEGVRHIGGNFEGCYEFMDRLSGTTAKECFGRGWDSINANRSFGWDKNLWVWAITFKRVTA